MITELACDLKEAGRSGKSPALRTRFVEGRTVGYETGEVAQGIARITPQTDGGLVIEVHETDLGGRRVLASHNFALTPEDELIGDLETIALARLHGFLAAERAVPSTREVFEDIAEAARTGRWPYV